MRMTHQIIIDGFLACLAVTLLQLGLLKGMGDVKGARIESAILVASVPGIIMVVRRGSSASSSSCRVPVDVPLRGIRGRRWTVSVQVPGTIRRVYIIVAATKWCNGSSGGPGIVWVRTKTSFSSRTDRNESIKCRSSALREEPLLTVIPPHSYYHFRCLPCKFHNSTQIVEEKSRLASSRIRVSGLSRSLFSKLID